MKKIYGNDYLLSTLESMVNCGRTAHTVLFYGEKGCGRKLIAKYYIKLFLCENKTDPESPADDMSDLPQRRY